MANWAPDGKRFVFGSQRDGTPQIYLGEDAAPSTTGGEPRAVFTNPRAGLLLDVTPDGSRALFLDAHAADNLVVVEVDAGSGKGRRLYPAEGKKVSVLTVSYSPNGKLAYITSDEGAESSIRVAIDVKTARDVRRFTNDSPAPMNAIVSPKGNRALRYTSMPAIMAKCAFRTALEVERAVQVPLGFIQLGTYRDDGKAFSLLISLPDLPPDVYEVNSATGSVKPLRKDPRRGLESLPPIEASVAETKAFDGLTIPINQYLPRGAAASKKLPTLAIFHGGLAYNYSVRWSNVNRFFSGLGYAVIEPNVRGSAGFGRA